jgi:hypothetical protein
MGTSEKCTLQLPSGLLGLLILSLWCLLFFKTAINCSHTTVFFIVSTLIYLLLCFYLGIHLTQPLKLNRLKLSDLAPLLFILVLLAIQSDSLSGIFGICMMLIFTFAITMLIQHINRFLPVLSLVFVLGAIALLCVIYPVHLSSELLYYQKSANGTLIITASGLLGYAVFLIGYWAKLHSWHNEYFLRFRAMRLYFAFAMVYLSLWVLLLVVGFYSWMEQWHLGGISFIGDSVGALLAIAYILVFTLIYIDSLRIGRGLVHFFKHLGQFALPNSVLFIIAALVFRFYQPIQLKWVLVFIAVVLVLNAILFIRKPIKQLFSKS